MRLIDIVLLGLALAGLGLPHSGAQEPNRAGLVVQFGDGTITTRCVEFSEARISGYDVLLRSGLAIEAVVEGGQGAFICGIEGEGCPASNCMCGFPPDYWSYWHLNGDWVYSQTGVDGYLVSPGDVEGWRWGTGSSPQAVPFDQICAPPATATPVPTATWTPSPTQALPSATASDTPMPTNTWTPSPTLLPPSPTVSDTPAPTDTPWPTATPVPTATDGPTSTPPAAVASAASPTQTPLPRGTHQPATPTEPMQSTATMTQTPTATATPSEPSATPALGMAATDTPPATQVALAPAPGRGQAASDLSSEGFEGGAKTTGLLTILSVGAGVAYVFFGLFLVLLAAIFVVVRLGQR